MTEWICITFKYGGYWVEVIKEDRRTYKGEKQRTIKVDKDLVNFLVIKEEVEAICPWIRGHGFKLHYHMHGTSPKQYVLIESDIEVIYMIEQRNGSKKVEVVVTIEDDILNSSQISHNIPYTTTSTLAACDDELLSGQLVEPRVLSIGACFEDSSTFKKALRTTAITKNFGVKFKSSNKTRVIATCSHRGCPWRIRASLCADGESFEVRRLEEKHTCPGVNRAGNKLATLTWVAQEIQDLVKTQPDIPPKQIKNHLEMAYGFSLPYMKLWHSREEARSSIFGVVDDNYKWVPTLRAELLSRNPGSHITYTYDSADNSFKRFYVSFKVCIDGFLSGCRSLIGLDACHLKSKYLGMLLSANALDGNNGLFTLAFAVVESESKKTWKWFLENLLAALGGELDPLAFISDMEKGLGDSIKTIFPNAEHRVCLRHLWKNLKKCFHCPDSHKLKSLVWSAANAYRLHEFYTSVAEVAKVSPHIHSYLLSLPYKWSRSTFLAHVKNNHNTNNMAESFNAWIGDARAKPVVDLIDMIRAMIMEQRAQRKLHSAEWRSELVPHIDEYIREVTTRKDHFIVRPSTESRAEVEGLSGREEVDIQYRECSCGYWQLTGLPCIHTVALIGSKEHPLWHTYVDEYYYLSRYKMAYDGAIATLSRKE